jgi:hypothetical protein
MPQNVYVRPRLFLPVCVPDIAEMICSYVGNKYEIVNIAKTFGRDSKYSFVYALILRDPSLWVFMDSHYTDEMIYKIIPQHIQIYPYLSKLQQKNKIVQECLSHASDRCIQKLISHSSNACLPIHIYKRGILIDAELLQFAPFSIRDDPVYVQQSIEQSCATFAYASRYLRGSICFIKKMMEIVDPCVLKYGISDVQDNEELALYGISRNASIFPYLSIRIRSLRTIVLLVLQQDGCMLEHVHVSLKKNEECIQVALQNTFRAFRFICDYVAKDYARAVFPFVLKEFDFLHPLEYLKVLQYMEREYIYEFIRTHPLLAVDVCHHLNIIIDCEKTVNTVLPIFPDIIIVCGIPLQKKFGKHAVKRKGRLLGKIVPRNVEVIRCALINDGSVIQYISPDCLLQYPDLAECSIPTYGLSIAYLPHAYRKNISFVENSLRMSRGVSYRYVAVCVRTHHTILRLALTLYPYNIIHLPESYIFIDKNDIQLLRRALQNIVMSDRITYQFEIYPHKYKPPSIQQIINKVQIIFPSWRNHLHIAKYMICLLPELLGECSDAIRGNVQITRMCALLDPSVIRFASLEIRSNSDIMLPVLRKCGQLWTILPTHTLFELHTMATIVHSMPTILRIVLPNDHPLTFHPHMFCCAIDNGISDIPWVRRQRLDIEFMKSIVNIRPNLYKYANKWIRRDVQIAFQVFSRDGLQLRHASARLKQNVKCVMTAVLQNSMAMRYAHKTLLNHAEIAWCIATRKNSNGIQFMDIDIRKNKDIMLACIQTTPSTYEFVHTSLSQNQSFQIESMKQSPASISFMHIQDYTNVIEQNHEIAEYISLYSIK